MDKAAYKRTAKIAKQFGAIKKTRVGRLPHRPGQGSCRAAESQGVDVYGKKWKKAVVKVTAGGK